MSFHHFYQLFIPFCFYSLQIVCFSTEDQSSQVKYSSNLDDQSEFISSTATNQSVISIENEASPLLKFSTNFFPFQTYYQPLNFPNFNFGTSSKVKIKGFYGDTRNYQTSNVILFDEKNVITTNVAMYLVTLNLVSNEFIEDVFFGQNSSEVYVVSSVTLGDDKNYTVEYYVRKDLKMTKMFKSQKVNSFDKSTVYQSKIYLLFAQQLLIFSTSLQLFYNFTLPLSFVTYRDIDMFNSTLIIAQRINSKQIASFYDMNQFDQNSMSLPPSFMDKEFTPNNFLSIKYVGKYFFIMTDISFQQYNASTGYKMHKVLFASPSSKNKFQISFVQNGTIILTSLIPSLEIYYFQYNSSYYCGDGNSPCTQCMLGYVLDNNMCHNQQEFADNLGWDRGQQYFQTLDPWPIPEQPQIPETPIQNEASSVFPYQQYIDTQKVREASSLIGNIAAFFTLKIAPKIMLSFFVFIEDIWLYQYHRKFSPVYPQSVYFFLQEASLIGQLKINPEYMRFLNSFQEESVEIQKNKQFLSYLNLKQENDVKNVYFLNSIESVYKNNFFMNVIFYVVLKAFHLLFYFLRQNFDRNKWNKYYLHFKVNTCWWSILISTIEANMMFLSFNVSLQFLLFSTFEWVDKINLAFSVLMLIVLIVYSFCFFFLVFFMTSKKYSQGLLGRCKFQIESFFFQSMMLVTRKMIRAVIHGFFLFNYPFQMSILLIFDIIYLLGIIKMRKFFVNHYIFFVVLLYNMSLLVFDFYFFAQVNFADLIKICDRQLFGFVSLSIMLLMTILESCYYLFEPLIKLIKKKCCKVTKITQQNQDCQKSSKFSNLSKLSNHKTKQMSHVSRQKTFVIQSTNKLKNRLKDEQISRSELKVKFAKSSLKQVCDRKESKNDQKLRSTIKYGKRMKNTLKLQRYQGNQTHSSQVKVMFDKINK